MQTATAALPPQLDLPPRIPGRPDPIDVHVGRRLRQARLERGLSQEKVAEALGLTFQQMQKYENGSNRVSASKMYRLANILGISPIYFFAGLGDPVRRLPEPDRAVLDAVRCLQSIPSPEVRQRVLQLIRAMAREAEA